MTDMIAPAKAVDAVMGQLNCWADGEWCGVCTARWGERGCEAAESVADTLWAMAAHCGCEFCSGETTATGECGCEFCEHRSSDEPQQDSPWAAGFAR